MCTHSACLGLGPRHHSFTTAAATVCSEIMMTSEMTTNETLQKTENTMQDASECARPASAQSKTLVLCTHHRQMCAPGIPVVGFCLASASPALPLYRPARVHAARVAQTSAPKRPRDRESDQETESRSCAHPFLQEPRVADVDARGREGTRGCGQSCRATSTNGHPERIAARHVATRESASGTTAGRRIALYGCQTIIALQVKASECSPLRNAARCSSAPSNAVPVLGRSTIRCRTMDTCVV